MNIPPIQVEEMFDSIQGEGNLSGYNTFFIRFKGCRIGCVFCDTKYSWKRNPKYDWMASDLLNEIIHTIDKNRWLCITGGEPLEQLKSLKWLIDKLSGDGYIKISIESAGVTGYTKGIAELPEIKDIIDMINCEVFFSLSPKLENALGKRFKYDEFKKICLFWHEAITVPYKRQFKFVVSTQSDLNNLEKLFSDIPGISKGTIIQVEESLFTRKEYVDMCLSFVRKFTDVRIGTQAHKILALR